jgi:hypothetical protein
MSGRSFTWYCLSGLVGVVGGWVLGSERGAIGVAIGWLICGIPIGWNAFRRWVAKNTGDSKMMAKQGLPVSAREILTRMAWVLGASFVLYWHYGPELGIGFWLAVLVYYQIALALQTIDRLNDQPR